MVVYRCRRLPDEGECIHIPQHLTEENKFKISADIHKFLPQIESLDLEHDYHGWNYFNAYYINEEGDRRRVHISEGSYIIKRSNTDWSVYPEQMFEKMYNLEGTADSGPLDNVITW